LEALYVDAAAGEGTDAGAGSAAEETVAAE